jgi:hypothetical protein
MRGEEVLEFNLSPYYFKTFKNPYFTYNTNKIPIISEGWHKIKNYYYLESETAQGIVLSHKLIYRLR